jgi:ABC-type branched-subunit amino acid transport system substrate-binding protein
VPFRERAGSAAEGAVFPLLFDAESAEAREFVRGYEEYWGAPPEFLAAHAWDGARLLIAAVRRTGLNRALARDALVALAPWPGATGLVTWDATGRNERAVTIGAWRGARACPIALRTPRGDAR